MHVMVRKRRRDSKLLILLLDTFDIDTDNLTYLEGYPDNNIVRKYARYHFLLNNSSVQNIVPDTEEEKTITALLSSQAPHTRFISYAPRFANPAKKQRVATTIHDVVVECKRENNTE